MRPESLNLALNCQSFDDFPTTLGSANAASLLRCWTVLWHPAIVASTQTRANVIDVREPLKTSQLVLVPEFIQADALAKPSEKIDTAVGHVVYEPRDSSRESLIIGIATRIGVALEPSDKSQLALHADLALDFTALGYAWLQVRLMTLRVRYSSNLDDEQFDSQLVQAARAWRQGNLAESKEQLTRCFDLLLEEKNRYYSVQPELMDLVLLDRTTLGATLVQQLNQATSPELPVNFLMTGSVAQELAEVNPNATARLRQFLDDGRAVIVGGLQQELPENLLPLESRRRQLVVGRGTLNSIFGTQPRIFLRRTFGIDPITPGLLEQFAYEGTVHVTLDGGRLPEKIGSDIRWVGVDGQTVPALTTAPVDAQDAHEFLDLGIRLARAIDADHTATQIFAHWPGAVCDSFNDLVRISKYGNLLGEFTTLNDHFDQAYDPGFGDTFGADEYESPYLKQSLQAQSFNPVSRFIDYWELHSHLTFCQALAVLGASRELANNVTAKLPKNLSPDLFDQIAADIDQLLNVNRLNRDQAEDSILIRDRLKSMERQLLDIDQPAQSEQNQSAWRVTNPHSFPVRCVVGNGVDELVDLPGSGSLTIVPNTTQSAAQHSQPPVDDGLTLRNEHFQLMVDRVTGGIRSVQTYDQRLTQASQRLSVRIPGDNRDVRYADMLADEVETKRIGNWESLIVSKGHLLDPDSQQNLCQFTQTVTVRRGDPIAEIDIQICPAAEWLAGLPNDASQYVCSRLAWHDETATLRRGAAEIGSNVPPQWIDAPNYIRVQQTDHAVTLFPGGLPWHRRAARKVLDTILIVHNEHRKQFRVGLGVDCDYDLKHARRWVSPALMPVACTAEPSSNGWLYHFSSKNVIVTSSEPILNEAGRVEGVRFRLLETEGRGGQLKIACPFPIGSASRMTLGGEYSGPLESVEGAVKIDFLRNEYFQINVVRAV